MFGLFLAKKKHYAEVKYPKESETVPVIVFKILKFSKFFCYNEKKAEFEM